MGNWSEPGSYDKACEMAATEQGLDPISERLCGEEMNHRINQTGGFCMVIFVPVGNDLEIGLTRDGSYVTCLYDTRYDTPEWEQIEEDHYAYLADLDKVVNVIREVMAATDHEEGKAIFRRHMDA